MDFLLIFMGVGESYWVLWNFALDEGHACEVNIIKAISPPHHIPPSYALLTYIMLSH